MADGGRFTRLSKVLAVVLLALFAAVYIAPSSSGYLSLVPGRYSIAQVAGHQHAGCWPNINHAESEWLQNVAMHLEPYNGRVRNNQYC